MEYSSNQTQIENANLLSGNLNGRISGGIVRTFLIIAVLIISSSTRQNKTAAYVSIIFTIGLSVALYVPMVIKRSRVLKNVVSDIKIVDDHVILRTTELNILFNKIHYDALEIAIQQTDKIAIAMDTEINLANFRSEIFFIDVNGVKYYVVGAYFDNYEELKKELFPILKVIIQK